MGSNTTRNIFYYIEYIQENKKYINIGITKYKEEFNSVITEINNLLGLNILSISQEEFEKRMEKLDGVDYIWVCEEIAKLGEYLSSVVLEERHPMMPKLNKIIDEDEEER